MPDRNGSGTTAEHAAAANQAAELLELGAGQFRLQGSLDLGAIPALARQGQRLFKRLSRDSASRRQSQSQFQPQPQPQPQPIEIQIDLGGVERSSSAAIALLLDWVAQAGRDGFQLRFAHWPEALRRIAIFSNVDGLLGLEADQRG